MDPALWWPVAVLVAIVAAVIVIERRPSAHLLFRYLPVPLWCYALPMVATTLGWLPRESWAYAALTRLLLPFALCLLLIGVDLPSVMRVGWRPLAATGLGSLSIVIGLPIIAWTLRGNLPVEAWKGVGTLAATWTGGSMNFMALRAMVQTPESIFTSLIIVDALIAYSWMALLVSLSSHQESLDRWLRAAPLLVAGPATEAGTTAPAVVADGSAGCRRRRPAARPCVTRHGKVGGTSQYLSCGLCAVVLVTVSAWLSAGLPLSSLMTSRQGWVVLIVTTLSLCGSLIRRVRALGQRGSTLGMPCLYLVLAATGAQASLSALRAAPVWVLVGLAVAAWHGLVMLVGGRWLRVPLRVLAMASQANLGGVVSTPLVAAVYDRQLVPVGVLLAVGCNAVGTYLGLASATLSRWLMSY